MKGQHRVGPGQGQIGEGEGVGDRADNSTEARLLVATGDWVTREPYSRLDGETCGVFDLQWCSVQHFDDRGCCHGRTHSAFTGTADDFAGRFRTAIGNGADTGGDKQTSEQICFGSILFFLNSMESRIEVTTPGAHGPRHNRDTTNFGVNSEGQTDRLTNDRTGERGTTGEVPRPQPVVAPRKRRDRPLSRGSEGTVNLGVKELLNAFPDSVQFFSGETWRSL